MKTAGTTGSKVLFTLAVFLLLSALTRALSGPALALAEDLTARALTAGEPAGQDWVSEPKPDPFPELASLIARLREKEDALMRWETELSARASTMDLMEQRIRAELNGLEKAEQALAATMLRAQTAAEDDLVSLTALYENMDAEGAAQIFRQMAPEFAAGFLARMRSDAAAAIMSGLEPEMAYSISVVLAGRHANVPVEEVPVEEVPE